MGIFSRLTDIVNSNINAALDRAEDPEKLVRLMIQEMEDTLVEVRSHAAKSIAERKERERHLDVLEREQQDWATKAELAVRKGRDDLAKSALLQRGDCATQATHIRHELDLISEQLGKLNEDIGKLEAKLNDAKARQRTIVMRFQHAQTTVRVRGQVHSHKIDDVMDRFDYAERRIDGLEAQAESYELGRGKSLKQEFHDLEADEQIQAELAALKAKLGKEA